MVKSAAILGGQRSHENVTESQPLSRLLHSHSSSSHAATVWDHQMSWGIKQRNGYRSPTTKPSSAKEVRYLDEDVPVDPISRRERRDDDGGTDSRVCLGGFSLRIVAEILPPSIDGQVLQATSVAMKGNKAIVSYAMRGEQYLGAIDVFSTSTRESPRLRSQALFRDTDIHSVSTHENYVYIAEATADGAYSDPAVLELVRLRANKLVLDGNQRLLLPSYAGTGVLGTGSTIYVTSGDNGALSVFDQPTQTLTNSVALHDARWVDVVDGKVVVVQGTPGQISVFDEGSLELLGRYPFTGADIAESKSTVQVVGGKAFIAAGNGGVQILSVNTGKVVGTVPLPDSDALGLDWSGVVTKCGSRRRRSTVHFQRDRGRIRCPGQQGF